MSEFIKSQEYTSLSIADRVPVLEFPATNDNVSSNRCTSLLPPRGRFRGDSGDFDAPSPIGMRAGMYNQTN
jgi:hypothetical protein